MSEAAGKKRSERDCRKKMIQSKQNETKKGPREGNGGPAGEI